jgi:cellulose synthase/poly-beta-1,6-N-acetylglucosamine synthase-like glycosyltransferase
MLPDLLFVPVAAAYVAILVGLFVYGVSFLWLTWVAIRRGPAGPPAPTPASWPGVTVQLPIYNEMYVAERLIDATARFDYPGELEIQVLDDSTDETVDIAAAAVARWRSKGVHMKHVRRDGRVGFKAGALAHGLSLARGEYVAIFDADFIPPADFLVRAVPVLAADPNLAFVQTRWGHANREFSLLTQLQSLWIDGHMAIEQFGRWRSGQWFNFNGSAGVWRRSALEDAGGWTHDTLTEDLDASYRAFRRGWRAAFVRNIECPAELPVSYGALRRQQHRWARGSFECALKHLSGVWHSPAPKRRKFQATLHLLGYSIHVQMLALALLYPLVLLVASRHPELLTLVGAVGVFNLAAIAPTTLFTAGQQQLGRRWWSAIPMILLLTILGAGLMVNTTGAAIQAIRRRPGTFERTPKFGVGHEKVDWQRLRYQPRLDPIVLGESAVAALCVWTVVQALQAGLWAIAFYAAIFAAGLGFSVAMTVVQSTRGAWAGRAAAQARIAAPGA